MGVAAGRRPGGDGVDRQAPGAEFAVADTFPLSPAEVRQELLSIRGLLGP
jgi:hypothetical protein